MTTPQNPKSGQEVDKAVPQASQSHRRLPKTHEDYWKARLERRCYTHNGKLLEVNEWSVRIQYLGQRKSFALATSDAEVATIKARDIYLSIVAKDCNLGEFLNQDSFGQEAIDTLLKRMEDGIALSSLPLGIQNQ